MSSAPLPELSTLSASLTRVEPAAATSPQGTETNTQFSTVLEGEQAALDAGSRDLGQDPGANDVLESRLAAPDAVATEAGDGNALPLFAGLEGIVVVEPGANSAAPVPEQEAGILKAQATVASTSDVSATLGRLMSGVSSLPEVRPDLTSVPLVHTGISSPTAPVTEAPAIATEKLSTLSAAVHRAVQSGMLPAQLGTKAAPAPELPAASLTTAQFAAVQVLGDDASTSAMTLANAAATTVANTGVNSVATTSGLPATTLDVPFRQTGWDGALGERVVWMVSQRHQAAEIKLNPPQLGPIEVRINIHNDQAQVTFTAQHANVRDALEAAIPRLKEMFGSTGVDLVDVGVSQQSFAQREGSRFRNGSVGPGSVGNDPLVLEDSSATVTRHVGWGPGIIDLFV